MTGQRLLQDRVAIVTGAGVGVGRAIASRLSASGAHVVLNDIDETSVREAEAIISEAGGDAAIVIGSVTNPKTGKELVKAARDRWGRLDILVNSASVTRDAMIHLMPDEWFALVMEVLVKGSFFCIRAAGPLLCAAAQPDLAVEKRLHRKIVNIASSAGVYGAAGKVAYAAATAAVIGMTKTVAREWAPFSVNCNAVAPGLISPRSQATTQANKDVMQAVQRGLPEAATQEYDFESAAPNVGPMLSSSGSLPKGGDAAAAQAMNATERMPLGRIGTPDDVAGAVEFLVGPDSDFITGAVLEVHGGKEFSS